MEWLNYHHLNCFWRVARAESITKASKELLLSPLPQLVRRSTGWEMTLTKNCSNGLDNGWFSRTWNPSHPVYSYVITRAHFWAAYGGQHGGSALAHICDFNRKKSEASRCGGDLRKRRRQAYST